MRLVWGLLALAFGAMALYGALHLLNGVAFLTGHGREITIHIERIRTASTTQPDGNGVYTLVPVKYGDGYYIDGSGQRRAISLPGKDLKAGTVVRTRHPVLLKDLVIVVHERDQAKAQAEVGLIGLLSGALGAYFSIKDP